MSDLTEKLYQKFVIFKELLKNVENVKCHVYPNKWWCKMILTRVVVVHCPRSLSPQTALL